MMINDDIDNAELTRRQPRRFGVTALRWKAEDMELHRRATRAVAVTAVGVMGITLMATAGTAGAAKRDVAGDAEKICQIAIETSASPVNLLDACALQKSTQDPDVALFSGKPREGAQNLVAQTRKASSVVLSLDDVYTRGKVPEQVQAAIDDACAYAAKSAELVAAEKVLYSGDDLGDDAKELAAAIHSEFFPDDLVDPCSP